jgi:hypothetical protein
MGKSKLLAQFASQLILQGRGVAVLDPAADLVDDILLLLLRHGYYRRPDALRKVLYVDFAEPRGAIAFNILKQPYPPYEVARNLVEATTRAWPSLSGGAAPQFENLLLASAALLIDNDLPLTALPRLLTDSAYRAHLLVRVRDPQVRDYFRGRYEREDASGRRTGGNLNESTLRRAFLLTYPPPLRYSLGQAENRLNLRAFMDRGVSLLVSLGGLDAQTQRLLGCLLTVGFEQAVLSRADLPPEARRPYHLIIDEFSQFSATSSEALERVLALARKYRLFLTLAHQTWGQAKSVQSALQNAAFLTFRPGVDDLAYAASRVASINPYQVKYQTKTHPVYVSASEQQAQWEYALSHLPPRHAYLRLRGRTIAFTTRPLPCPTPALLRELDRLKETYARQLLTPHDQVRESTRDPDEMFSDEAGRGAPPAHFEILPDI